MKQIQDKVWLSMKKRQTRGNKITAKDLKTNLDNVLRFNEGHKIFRTLRGTPPYWENAEKKIICDDTPIRNQHSF